MYDSRLGRWSSVDELFYMYPYTSSYLYTLNSPLLYLDSDGRVVVPTSDKAISLWETYKANADERTALLIKTLEDSDIIYQLDYTTVHSVDEAGGRTLWITPTNPDPSSQIIQLSIQVPDNEEEFAYAIQILGDEAVHAGQFDRGEIGFYKVNSDPVANVSGYDYLDETASKVGSVSAAEQNGVSEQLKLSAKAFKKQVLEKGSLYDTKKLQKFYKNYVGKDGSKYSDHFSPGGAENEIPGYLKEFDGGNTHHLQKECKNGEIDGYIYRTNGKTKLDAADN
jgi:hypothetical protein